MSKKNDVKLINTEKLEQENLKIISLNIWGGYIKEPLIEFFYNYKDIDIFCLQEVYNGATHKISSDDKTLSLNILSELHSLLPNHNVFFKPVVGNNYGIAIFIKKNIEVIDEGIISIHHNPNYIGQGPAHSRIMQWIKFKFNKKLIIIFNVHGLWNGKGKGDSLERISQSQKIKTFVDKSLGYKIICGDFNLRPDTESIKIIEKDLINMISIFNIDSTRTELYDKTEKYADYFFISPQLNFNKFEVLTDTVSDHSPLYLEIIFSEDIKSILRKNNK